MLLTLDLFDTLVSRRCGCAEALADEIGIAAAREELLPNAEAYSQGVAGALRALGPCRGGDWPLDAIHGAMTGVGPLAAKRLTALAVEVEVAMAQPIGASLARFDQARASGARVAFVSDTNLARADILRVLAQVGVDADSSSDLFLSSEGQGRKADGSLFGAVRAAFDPKPESWVHLGDNAVSDGLHAELAGARVELVRDSPRADERLVARLAAEVRTLGEGAVVVWGAGQRGWALLRACRLVGVAVEAFWDRAERFQRRAIDGVPIVAPYTDTVAQHVLLAVPAPAQPDARMRELTAWHAPRG